MFGWRGRNGRTDAAGAGTDVEDQAGAVDADEGGIQRRWNGDDENGNPAGRALSYRKSAIPCAHDGLIFVGEGRDGGQVREILTGTLGFTHSKHRPRLAGGGENLPLEILRSLSVWVSVLDERGVMPGALLSSSPLSDYAWYLLGSRTGSVLGGMYGGLSAFEDSLCSESITNIVGRARDVLNVCIHISSGKDTDHTVAIVSTYFCRTFRSMIHLANSVYSVHIRYVQ